MSRRDRRYPADDPYRALRRFAAAVAALVATIVLVVLGTDDDDRDDRDDRDDGYDDGLRAPSLVVSPPPVSAVTPPS